MKTRFISFFLFMLAMSCFVACSDDDPATDPEPEPELEPVETVNTYTYKDKTIQAKSVSCFEQDGIVYVCMSPLQSLETLEDFMNSGKEYVMLGVDKSLVGSPVTVGSSEGDDYVLYYMDADGEAIVAVDPYEWEEVLTQGKITLTMTPGENEISAVKATFDCTLKSGGKFTGEAGCSYKAPAKLPSEFSFGSEVRPLKSAVATVIGGIQYLYLSPDAGVTTVEDMSDTEFLMIGINPDMLGQVLDITSYDGTDYAFYNMTELGADDLGAVEPYGWSEICSAGKFKVEKTDDLTARKKSPGKLPGERRIAERSATKSSDHSAPLAGHASASALSFTLTQSISTKYRSPHERQQQRASSPEKSRGTTRLQNNSHNLIPTLVKSGTDHASTSFSRMIRRSTPQARILGRTICSTTGKINEKATNITTARGMTHPVGLHFRYSDTAKTIATA